MYICYLNGNFSANIRHSFDNVESTKIVSYFIWNVASTSQTEFVAYYSCSLFPEMKRKEPISLASFRFFALDENEMEKVAYSFLPKAVCKLFACNSLRNAYIHTVKCKQKWNNLKMPTGFFQTWVDKSIEENAIIIEVKLFFLFHFNRLSFFPVQSHSLWHFSPSLSTSASFQVFFVQFLPSSTIYRVDKIKSIIIEKWKSECEISIEFGRKIAFKGSSVDVPSKSRE